MKNLNVIVGVKRVIDYAMKLKFSSDKSGVNMVNMKMIMNPYCEVALEQAVRFKETFNAQTTAISIGPKACQDTLRTAMAIGVDRAIHVHIENLRTDQDIQPLTVAKIMKRIILRDKINLVLLGQQSVDGDNAQTGPMLAAILSWPQATFVTKIEPIKEEDEREYFLVDKETDIGMETLAVPIPAVLTTSLRLIRPRFATLPNIMKAKKKEIEILLPEDLGLTELDLAPRNITLSVQECPPRKAGIILGTVDELLDRLRKDGVIK